MKRDTSRGGDVPLLLRLLLQLYPGSFLEAYGTALEEVLARRWAEARASGVVARGRLLLRESWGLAVGAWAERRAGLRKSGSRGDGSGGRSAMRIDPVWRELRHALRRLARTPAFSVAAALTLALAIAANVTLFTLVRRVVIAPLPYPESDRLVALEHGAPGLNLASGLEMTTGLYVRYREDVRALEGLALYQTGPITVSGPGEPEEVTFSRATASLLDVLRVHPALGRWFTDEEGLPGSAAVVVLTHGNWQRRFGGDAGVIGRTLTVSEVPSEVIGVLPAEFDFPSPATDLWLPFGVHEGNTRAGGFNFQGIGRLRDAFTLEDLRAQMNGAIARLPEAFPGDAFARSMVEEVGVTSTAIPLKQRLIGRIEDALWILLGAAGMVLLIACANVANLFLVRMDARQREVAVRRALGASRGGVAGYFLAESFLLAAAGGIAGLGLAFAGVRALVALGPRQLPRLHEVAVDAGVLAFAAAITLLSALLFGGLPLLRRMPSLAAALHEGGRGNTASRARLRLRHALVAAQMALALMLLVASGLMIRSFDRMRSSDPGFRAEDRLVFRIGLPSRNYTDIASRLRFHDALLERVGGMPGVRSVSAANCLPLEGICFGDPLTIEGRAPRPGEPPPIVRHRRVAEGYFETVGMDLVAGRLLEAADQRRPSGAGAVIDRALADLYFPGEDPIGKRVYPGVWPEGPPPGWFTIVGIVENSVTMTLTEERGAKLYLPLSSGPFENTPNVNVMTYVLHAAVPPSTLLPAIRSAVSELDANVPVARAETLGDMVSRAGAAMAFTMALLAVAATVALLLGVIGIYGVISYAVSQRSGEIGVRLALGARPGDVSGMIVKQGGVIAAAGLVLGLIGALAASRLMSALLYQVEPTDAATYATVAVGLLGVALFACWLPARRASRTDPLQALRVE